MAAANAMEREGATTGLAIVTLACCGACVAAYAYLALASPEAGAAFHARFGDLPWAAVRGGGWASLFTSTFVHVDLVALAFNVLVLSRLGAPFERTVGPAACAAVYVAAAILASLAELAAVGSTGIGISGVVYALFGMLWRARGRDPRLDAALPRPAVAVLLVVLFGGIALHLLGGQYIGNAAHVAGLAAGAAVPPGWWVRPAPTPGS